MKFLIDFKSLIKLLISRIQKYYQRKEIKVSDINDIIKSVISKGSNSHHLNDFIKMCLNLSLATLRRNIYRESVLSKTGLSERDFAFDAIADIFKNTDGKYKYLENHFSDVMSSIDNLPPEVIQAKLNALIVSRTNQRITEIREEFGEIYFRVKRAIHLHISRHKNIKSTHFCGVQYFYICDDDELNEEHNEITQELILDKLNSVYHKKLSVSTIVDFVINFVNSQNEILRAISDNLLCQSVTEFYNLRKKDYLIELENVHYINYEE